MSGPLKKDYFCIADKDFLTVVEKLRGSNLSDVDKELISHILLNHRHVMLGLLNGTIKGKELEKQIKKLGEDAKKKKEEQKVAENSLVLHS